MKDEIIKIDVTEFIDKEFELIPIKYNITNKKLKNIIKDINTIHFGFKICKIFDNQTKNIIGINSYLFYRDQKEYTFLKIEKTIFELIEDYFNKYIKKYNEKLILLKLKTFDEEFGIYFNKKERFFVFSGLIHCVKEE